jgi:hypothetical protein
MSVPALRVRAKRSLLLLELGGDHVVALPELGVGSPICSSTTGSRV